MADHFRSSNFAFPQVLHLGLELGLVLELRLGSGLGFSLGLPVVLYMYWAFWHCTIFFDTTFFQYISISNARLGYVTSSNKKSKNK